MELAGAVATPTGAPLANGIPAVKDFNNLDQNAGIAPFPVNIDGLPGSTARSGTSTLSVTGSL